RRALREGY
nr:Chain C, 8-pepide (ARG-ARG-ALA-LEU-ARG-GLU-GLY-TYR) [synthetic construct]